MFVVILARLHEGKVYPLFVSPDPAVVAAARRAFMDVLLPLDEEVWDDTWGEEKEENEENER